MDHGELADASRSLSSQSQLESPDKYTRSEKRPTKSPIALGAQIFIRVMTNRERLEDRSGTLII